MEIEVGEYIRTTQGYIGKFKRIEFDDIDKSLKWYYFDKKEPDINIIKEVCTNKPYITKHSKNIIDLIEEYDFVNEEEVDKIKIDQNGEKYIKTVFNNVFRNKDIKSILTKEQYEQNSYKIGE